VIRWEVSTSVMLVPGILSRGRKNNNRQWCFYNIAGIAGQIWFEVSHREWENANIIGGLKEQTI